MGIGYQDGVYLYSLINIKMNPIIIIPNYNDNKYLLSLVKKIRSYTNTQILIIDDETAILDVVGIFLEKCN